MESFWLVAYLIVAGLAIVQSLLVGLQTWEHRRYARSCMGRLSHRHPSGRVAVFAPCKGVDVELEGNLNAVLQQDYDDCEVTFVVESEDDPACPVILRAIAEHPSVAARLVIAGRATRSGQKVHNLLAAVADLSPRVKYLAFVDSDARPRPNWLRSLIQRLDGSGVGAVTGYRWCVPLRDSNANHLLYSMNCDVMSLLGKSSHYLIWGGSWGIRREVFESIGLYEAWKGTLSDDLIASRQLRRAKVPVRFEPACMMASPVDHTFGEMFAFIRRQYTVCRFYVPDWWVFAIAVATFTNVAFLSNLVALGWSLVYGTLPVWIPAGMCGALYLLSVQRGMVRQDLIQTYFPERQRALRKARRFDVWMNSVVGLVNWMGVLASLFGRHIKWRGISYRMGARGKILAILRADDPAPWPDGKQRSCPVPDASPREFVPRRKAG